MPFSKLLGEFPIKKYLKTFSEELFIFTNRRLFFFFKKDTTAGLGSYAAVGTPFQAMTNLSLKVFCDVEVLSFVYKMLYVETLLSTVILSGEITTIAETRSLTKPVLFLQK